ncbi:ArsR/SmtB family transcription factor [Desertibacillus haloalkaliphilus]|uniref:ArsR/SmtB family transcription factor n=1 Tax=Desertibacillus haloalkaliphilus TaxID=1328930 RepID=UPI001C25AC30|nr:metalloregulator ArsR/SmtB family transcription factor [Desertibacillus haloalkaliphilus]MBU8905270.1 metalloregulator ArsR/SmtB family transcription factor [Desertibacillus haloalkaliphilus]
MSKNDTCEIFSYDETKVKQIQELFLSEDLAQVAKFFKALADEKRTKIAYALTKEEELCVCDLATIIGASVATTSHHLRTMHKLGIVKYRKKGKLAFYSLDDDHVKQLLLITLAHQKEAHVNV